MCNRVLEQVHASYVETVPFRHIAAFTIFEFLFLGVCFGVTWIPVAGVLFPLPFFLLIAIRQHLLPKIFPSQYLRELDAAEYEEFEGTLQRSLSLSLRVRFFAFISFPLLKKTKCVVLKLDLVINYFARKWRCIFKEMNKLRWKSVMLRYWMN